MTTQLISVLRCPTCEHEDALSMPTDACLFFHPCAGCGAMLRPKSGDCCVFCSYGSVPCPPIQEGSGCCGHAAGTGDEATAGRVAPLALTPIDRRGRA